MVNKSFFFIPDISGFTSFVNGVDIDHSQHIVSELLELIIDEDELGLSLAEVEGDAVFLYKNDEIPSFKSIVKQISKTYRKFHEHLMLYNTRRVCHCGACTSASELTLKFIVHVGESSLMNVKGHSKPYGTEVIKVHRLMKNSIAGNDYALFSQELLEELGQKENQELQLGNDNYEELGTVEYQSMDLHHLKAEIPVPAIPLPGYKIQEPIVLSQSIDSAKGNVFELITNLDKRKDWSIGPSAYLFDEKVINRIGTKHVCIVGDKNIEFETVTGDFGKNKLVYGEKTKDVPIFKEATTYFILEGDDKSTDLKVEFHFELIPVIGWLLKPFIMKKFVASIKENLKMIKKFAEAA